MWRTIPSRFRALEFACAAMALVLASVSAGCHCQPCACDDACVSAKVAERTGHRIARTPCHTITLPDGVYLGDGLTEDEAVLIALWNNAAFQHLLADLGIARGDLIQAGLLPNPEVGYFFSVPDKPFKYVVDMPLEALWLRPIRVAAASRESARVCDQLTQSALDLMRDVRQAYAAVLLARGRRDIAGEAVRIRGRISELAEARRKAGDIGVQEAATARIDAIAADQDALAAAGAAESAEEKLRHLMGIGVDREPLKLDATPTPDRADLDVEALTAEAVANRPDALAAEQAAAAAAERLRLSELSWIRFLGILDATSGRDTGHEFGPALRVTLPIFNQNQGAIARAAAELEKAQRQQQVVRHQIILDVYDAHVRYRHAREEAALLRTRVQPEAEAAIRRAESAYRDGEASYLIVLETTRQLLDSRLRQQQLEANLRTAWADLERGVARRLDDRPSELPTPDVRRLPSVESILPDPPP